MIEKISLDQIATYTLPVEILPKKINFIYGSNGSGKTTISNLLGNYTHSEECSLEKNSSNDRTLVYNKLFVKENFSQPLKGIFTFGEESVQQQEEIKRMNEKNQSNKELNDTKERTKQGFLNEIESKKDALSENCWKIQQNIGSSFSNALIGYRNSKKNFCEQCLTVFADWHNEGPISLESLKKRYDIAYSKESEIYPIFPKIDLTEIDNIEQSPLLQKVISGSSSAPIGQFIEALKNSDWVKEGLEFFAISQDKCPFCSQPVSENLKKEIEDYFDEQYDEDRHEIEKFIKKYKIYFENISVAITDIEKSELPFINLETLRTNYLLFQSQFELNMEKLEKKQKSLSMKIELDSLKNILEDINSVIDDYNATIDSNNCVVANQKQEQKNVTHEIWNYIISELEIVLTEYQTFVNGKNKAIKSIEGQLKTIREEIKNNEDAIEIIEKSLTSVAPTVTEINKLLEKFDFKGFYLKENKEHIGTYLILREDGSNAQETLSEGEYNFITFLYFYYLVYGSQERTGITSNKIIVIDDPISSLDSNILFIASTLVKKIISDCRDNIAGIKQVFILTHNVYFHKEVTFLGSRKQFSNDEVLFGIIRKEENISKFKAYPENPIESTYQLMWRELRDENCSTVTSFNTMRRLLEYYFNIIGDMQYEKCINNFEGTDKLVCKALISCINDGSHFISDDFVIAFDEENVENYKKIFELIFKKMGHEQHYNMMMGKNE